MPANSGASGGSSADCKPGLTMVRLSILSAPTALSNWTNNVRTTGAPILACGLQYILSRVIKMQECKNLQDSA